LKFRIFHLRFISMDSAASAVDFAIDKVGKI